METKEEGKTHSKVVYVILYIVNYKYQALRYTRYLTWSKKENRSGVTVTVQTSSPISTPPLHSDESANDNHYQQSVRQLVDPNH
jgi:hypothetical protein